MGIFKNIIGSAESDKRENALSGTNLATGRAEFYGSVHSGGDVDVTVNRQYGERQTGAISVRASVHGSGNEDLTVEELVDYDEVPDEWELPESPVREGSTPVHRRNSFHGNVHDYGSLDLHIDRLVVVPTAGSDRHRVEGDDGWLRAFAERGFDVSQELDVRGSVHDRGKLSATIENLIVME